MRRIQQEGKTLRKLYGHHSAGPAAFPDLVKRNIRHHYWSAPLHVFSGVTGNCACVTVNDVFLR